MKVQEILRGMNHETVGRLSAAGKFEEAEVMLQREFGGDVDQSRFRQDATRLYEAWARTYYEANDLAATAAKLQRCLEVGGLTDEKEMRMRTLVLHIYRRLGRTDAEHEALRLLEGKWGGSSDAYVRNQILNEREITEKKTVLKSFPNRLTVRLTNRCNILCKMCVMPTEKTWSVPKKTMDEVEALSPYLSDLQWQGGEPFVVNHAYLSRLIHRAAENPHLSQNIITNGLLMDREWVRTLVRCNVHTRISIDGATKEVFEDIRVGGKWDDLLNGIELFNEERARQNRHVRLELHMVVMRSNYHQLEQMIDFAQEHHFDIVDFSHIVIGANSPDEDIFERGDPQTWAVLQDQRARAKAKALRYGLRFGDTLPFPPPGMLPEAEGMVPRAVADAGLALNVAHGSVGAAAVAEEPMPPFYCLSPWKQLIIREDGHLITNWHCIVNGRHMHIGHCEQESLFDGWNSEAMQVFRRKIAGCSQRGHCTPFCLSGSLIDHWRDHIEFI